MNFAQPRSYRIFGAVTLLLLALLVAAPLACLYAQSFWRDGSPTVEAYRNVLLTSRQWLLLARSLFVAASVTAFATLLGAAAAFSIDRCPQPLRAPAVFLLSLPALVPQHIMAIAWVDVLGRNGYAAQFVRIALPGAPPAPSLFTVAGAIFILSITFFPIPLLATHAALRMFDARFIEAACVAGQRRRALQAIVLPLILPATLTGATLVFAMTLSTFSVPSLLQVNTYPVEIHASSSTFDYGAAAAQSLPMIALCATGFLTWTAYVRPRHAWLAGRRRRATQTANAAPHLLATVFVLLLIACAWAAPMIALFIRSLPLRTYATVWQTAHDEIANGILTAACTATLLTPLALALTYAGQRRYFRILVRTLGLFTFVIPGPLLALGMISLWNRPGAFGVVYDSIAILVLASMARFFAVAEITCAAGFSRLSPGLHEAAAVSGVHWWRAMLAIAAPLLTPYAVVVWVLTFVLSLGEVDAAVLLCPPGKCTFAVRLFSLMHYGPDSFVAALSLFTALAITAVAACGMMAFEILTKDRHA